MSNECCIDLILRNAVVLRSQKRTKNPMLHKLQTLWDKQGQRNVAAEHKTYKQIFLSQKIKLKKTSEGIPIHVLFIKLQGWGRLRLGNHHRCRACRSTKSLHLMSPDAFTQKSCVGRFFKDLNWCAALCSLVMCPVTHFLA